MKNKHLLIITNLILLIYILTSIFWLDNYKATLIDVKTHPVFILTIMFIFELISTFTFQARIKLTQKSKYKLAALIGAISWMVAGLQGLVLINGDIDGMNNITTFFIKMPPVMIATFNGILILGVRNGK